MVLVRQQVGPFLQIRNTNQNPKPRWQRSLAILVSAPTYAFFDEAQCPQIYHLAVRGCLDVTPTLGGRCMPA